MDKYAVVIDDEKVKTSSIERRCPKCGKDLSDQPNGHGGDFIPPFYCPNCGTEPFEKRPEK
jgi:predicted RNA-binding Zn-ribbon protein involved in translation (DUF1610 family)